MKTLFFSLSLMLVSLLGNTQSMTLTITQQPCNNNGIVTANITGLTTPLTVTWYVQGLSAPITHTNVTTLTDVLTGYSGAPLSVTASSSGAFANAYTSAMPFNITPNNISMTPGVCPTLGIGSVSGISGGVPPYSYEWLDASTSALISTANPASLPNGNYHLKITDNAGCSYTYTDSLMMYQTSGINFTTSVTTANCTNGSATINSPNGGVAPYTYSWNTGSVSPSITNVMAGPYFATVTDAQGCTKSTYIEILQAVTINVPITPTNSTCIQNNGSAIAFGSGGVPPYTYAWNNSLTTQTISNLSPGYYQVTATDNNGCIGYGQTYIGTSTPINATYSATSSSCTSPTGTATLTISGGASPYTIVWNTFPVQTGLTATNLPQGYHNFTITDNNGCIRTGSAYVDVLNPIYASVYSTNATCLAANGSAFASVSGGTPPFTYAWSNSTTNSNLTGVGVGYYSVVITDNASCSVTKGVQINSSSPINLGVTVSQASCQFTNDGSITLQATGGAAPYSYSIDGNSVITSSTLATGNHYGYVSDANGCVASVYPIYVGYNASNTSCYCTLNGVVFHDANNNCVQDAGELGIPNIQIHCSGNGYVYTNANGEYEFKVPSGNYTLSESVQSIYPLSTCQNNSINITASATTGCIITNNFANTINPLHDLHTNVWNMNQPVPGNGFSQKSIIKNLGTVAESTYVASYLNDGQLNAASFTPSVFTSTSNPNYYEINGTNLNVGQEIVQFVNYNTPTNIPMGTVLEFKDSVASTTLMSNWLNDYSPWNNVNQESAIVVSSYDPNFKEVSPKGVGAQGFIYGKDTLLDYMIHFQNLGTYYAQNVVVLDTLDADLDWKTLRMIYQSHNCTVTINENGVARFEFKNIHLSPEMYNDGLSNGMVSYMIKRKANLPVGTKIENSASIYFDYNEPIKTNTTLNTIGAPQSVESTLINEESLEVYPNPSSDLIYVNLKNQEIGQDISLSILDISGKRLTTNRSKTRAANDKIVTQVGSLAPGIYFAEIVTVKGKQSAKFVKQ